MTKQWKISVLSFIQIITSWKLVVCFLPQLNYKPLSFHISHQKFPTHLCATNNHNEGIVAVLSCAPTLTTTQDDALRALKSMDIFSSVFIENDENKNSISENVVIHKYKYIKATGMLKLMDSIFPNSKDSNSNPNSVPQWIPIHAEEEKFLVSRGWSFLDPDESEPVSAFDIDAANEEGLYVPKWKTTRRDNDDDVMKISSLGFSLIQPSQNDIELASSHLLDTTKNILLYGDTDVPGIKMTHNQFDFSGPASQDVITKGIFMNPITNIPLFSTTHLSPLTASSGWLSFFQPIAQDHIELIFPEKGSVDSRVEVVCAQTKCHLGHYFGKGEGYCINAGALNFMPSFEDVIDTPEQFRERHKNAHISSSFISSPSSWKTFDNRDSLDMSTKMLHSVLLANCNVETITLGAGCFWHVEYALSRLPGVISTQVGYAGGNNEYSTSSRIPLAPTYEKVCKGKTGFAEVVHLSFDPNICKPEELLDCFFSLHDPTKVRAHGKHEKKVGQYRSCIFVSSDRMNSFAENAIKMCQSQLQKELSTELYFVAPEEEFWFWRAEDRHQLYFQRKKNESETCTISFQDWIDVFGRRKKSILGSSETITYMDDDDGDDGMARMMI